MSKPILCFDFDGVIHSYDSGWVSADVIRDEPVPGALSYLEEALKHFRVAIFSSRSHQPGGIEAMQRWLRDRHPMGDTFVAQIEWPTSKPPAFLTIDDRAHCFDGRWPDLIALKEFKPWNKR